MPRFLFQFKCCGVLLFFHFVSLSDFKMIDLVWGCMFLLFDGVCLLKRSYMEICVRNYPEFSARYSQSSRPWKEQDLAVNQGFRPYALYILHLRRQRIFFSTVLSLVSFTWCVFSSLVFIPFSRSLDELYAFSSFFVCVLVSFNILFHSPIQTGHYRGCCPFKV